ncbi:hypothetical protein DET54_102421 [Paenibacillus pabuli]|uniref:Alpha/beta hydrolase family protein n=1 Tax=Paenibacillus pabuli TaxID=1472 RepID=A0ABX9BQ75_9BACL|nr:hypothetical protein DET54_102421 [Paenibacillus pabuli]
MQKVIEKIKWANPKSIKRLEDNNIMYKIIEDAGHAINHEQADVINKEIIEFLK